MFTHDASVLLISLNMETRDLSVNKWENKVTGFKETDISCKLKSNALL